MGDDGVGVKVGKERPCGVRGKEGTAGVLPWAIALVVGKGVEVWASDAATAPRASEGEERGSSEYAPGVLVAV